jgi:hypothetical protein
LGQFIGREDKTKVEGKKKKEREGGRREGRGKEQEEGGRKEVGRKTSLCWDLG